MSMNRYANAGPIMSGLAAMSEPTGRTPDHGFAGFPSLENVHPLQPQPIAIVEHEGGHFRRWVSQEEHAAAVRALSDRLADMDPAVARDEFRRLPRNPERFHAVFFDDGSVFDNFNGWREKDACTVEIINRIDAAWKGDGAAYARLQEHYELCFDRRWPATMPHELIRIWSGEPELDTPELSDDGIITDRVAKTIARLDAMCARLEEIERRQSVQSAAEINKEYARPDRFKPGSATQATDFLEQVAKQQHSLMGTTSSPVGKGQK